MNEAIALVLFQDGITTGAIYVLVALAIVLVFTVTRVLFVPQGEFVTLGALTLATLQDGRLPGVVWLLLGLGACVVLVELRAAVRTRRWPPFRTALARWRGVAAGAVRHHGLDRPGAAALVRFRLCSASRSSCRLARCSTGSPFSRWRTHRCCCCCSSRSPRTIHWSDLELLFFGAEGWRTPAFLERTPRRQARC